MAWEDRKRHFEQAGSIRGSLEAVMGQVQGTIAQIDHMANLYTEWQDEVAAGRMDQAFVDALDDLKADLIPLRAACVTYRDQYQGT